MAALALARVPCLLTTAPMSAPDRATHRHAAPGAIPGVAYRQAADERSFDAARAFLAGAHAPA
jgi:hypothetical protein